jgi:hypothetical protein
MDIGQVQVTQTLFHLLIKTQDNEREVTTMLHE